MAINTQNIRIDLNPGRSIPVAFMHQNDTNRQLTFELYNNGVAYTPASGSTVKFAYKSPIVNGQYSVITGSQMASGTVSGNTVTVTLPAAYTQVSGVGLLTMILTTSGNTLRPVNIKFVCQGSADGDDTVLGASDWPEGLYDYMDNWLAENEPTEIANLKSDLKNIGLSKIKNRFVGNGNINANGAINYNGSSQLYVLEVDGGENLKITSGSSATYILVTTVFNYGEQPTTSAESGFTSRIGIGANATKTFVLPSDAKYIIFSNAEQESVVLDGYDYSKNAVYNIKTLETYATPEMYGAVGDGMTDDSVAIQECLNNHRTVFFGGSSYTFKDINIPHDCDLRFKTTIIPQYYDATKNVYHSLFIGNGVNINIDGLNVQGSYTDNTTDDPETTHPLIKAINGRVYIENSVFAHLNLNNRASTPSSVLEREAAILTAINSDVAFVNCEFSDIKRDELIWVFPTGFSSRPTKTVRIEGCNFHDGYGYSLINAFSRFAVFSNNIIRNWDYNGSALNLFSDYVSVCENQFVGNAFSNILDTEESNPGDWFPDNVLFANNYITNSNVSCDILYINASFVKVFGNIIVGGRIFLKSRTAIPLIGIQKNASFHIENNYFRAVGFDNINQKLLHFDFADTDVRRDVYLSNNQIIGDTQSDSYASIGCKNVDNLYIVGNLLTAASFSTSSTSSCVWINIMRENEKTVKILSKANMMRHSKICGQYYYIVNSSSADVSLLTIGDSFDANHGNDGYLLNVSRTNNYQFPEIT